MSAPGEKKEEGSPDVEGMAHARLSKNSRGLRSPTSLIKMISSFFIWGRENGDKDDVSWPIGKTSREGNALDLRGDNRETCLMEKKGNRISGSKKKKSLLVRGTDFGLFGTLR